jgi:general secretion pathway protein A
MYAKFFNLREEPFRLTPDPRFLHLAEPHRMALKVLLEGILMRKGFLVLCGPTGTGKTMLMNAALCLLEENAALRGKLKTAFLIDPTLRSEEFLEAVLDEFEVPCSSTSKPQRLAALYQMLVASQQHGGTGVLVIDEAHLLARDVLEQIRLLSNMDTYQETPLQIILSGLPELQIQLHEPNMQALQQRIAATCHLRPLNLQETRVYVMQRLHVAGLRGDSPFSDTVLDQVFAYTGGVPRLINLVCGEALTSGSSKQKCAVDSLMIEEAAHKLNLLTGQVEAAPRASLDSRGNLEQESTRQEIRGTAPNVLPRPVEAAAPASPYSRKNPGQEPSVTQQISRTGANLSPWQVEVATQASLQIKREPKEHISVGAMEEVRTTLDMLILAMKRSVSH